MKIPHIAIRAVAVMMTAAVVVPAVAKKNTIDFSTTPKSGLNASDYLLQKPLGNPTFPEGKRSFGRHSFLEFNAGGSLFDNNISSGVTPGMNVGLRLGSWITPVHGIRIGADAGFHSVHKDVRKPWFMGVHADYLLNITNLLRGYNPSRRFELVSIMGVNYQRLRQSGMWDNIFGGSFSLQTRFNVAPSLYLYLEPQLALTSGKSYDSPHTWRRMSTELTFNLGIGYRILTGNERRMGSSIFTQSKEDNLYFGLGGGALGYLAGSPKIKNPFVNTFVGKMFSSISGLQLNLATEFNHIGTDSSKRRLSMASLNYILNINNAFGGYRPNETFQMLVNIGPAISMVHSSKQNSFHPGIQFGVTGLFRLSENWGIYLHPQISGFSQGFYNAVNQPRRPLASFDIGLRYTIGNFYKNHPESVEEYNADKHWFITFGGGAFARVRNDSGKGANLFVGFGKRFTPISSWRVNVDVANDAKSPFTTLATLHADYLSSITTAMMGYNPDRVFDLQLAVGAFAGVASRTGTYRKNVGLEAGLQANFRLSPSFDLFIEPQALLAYMPTKNGGMAWSPEARFQIGLRYRLGSSGGEKVSLAETPYGIRRNFAGISFGPSLYVSHNKSAQACLNGLFDLSIGRWFSKVSAFRGVISNDILRNEGSKTYLLSAHLDYMLNVSSLMDSSANRKFHVIGIVGAGFGINSKSKRDIGLVALGGAQFRYNLPANIDIHLEPTMMLWQNRMLPGALRGNKVGAAPRISIGASYRF